MNEFKQIKSLYKKHTHYHRNIFLISGILIVSISIFVAVDVVRVNPLIFYAVGVGIVTFYALFNRVESSNYDQLKKFLKDYQPDILDDKEFLFFLDYQLSNHLNRKSEVWFQELNDSSELKKIVPQEHQKNAFESQMAIINSFKDMLVIRIVKKFRFRIIVFY